MSDEQQPLRETLDQLRSQLDELRKRDPAFADQLEATIAEARQALDAAPAASHNASIVKRLSEALLEYEATHPSLAGSLGSVIDALGRMGI